MKGIATGLERLSLKVSGLMSTSGDVSLGLHPMGIQVQPVPGAALFWQGGNVKQVIGTKQVKV